MNPKHILKLATSVTLAVFLFQGCASSPPQSLLDARSEVAAAERDGSTAQYAPTSLAEAQEQLKDAERANDSRRDEDTVDHEANLARSKALTAVAQGRAGKSQAEFAAAEAERQRMLTSRLEGLATRALNAAEKAEADLKRAEEARLAAEDARRRAEDARAALNDAGRNDAAAEAAARAAAERARAEELERQLAAERARQPVVIRDTAADDRLRELNAVPTPRGNRINIPDVLFAFDSANLNERGLRIVQQINDFLRDYPDRNALVEGHTDDVGSRSYNQRLSEKRAESVAGSILRAGISAGRVVAVGYSEDYPVASNESDAGRAQNRRVEVYISDDNAPVKSRLGR